MNATLNLEREIANLERELATLKRSSFSKLERRIDRLLSEINEQPETESLRERLFTVLASAALAASLMKSPTVPAIFLDNREPRVEQLSPLFSSALESRLAKSEGQLAPSLAKPTSKPEAKLDFPTKVKQVAERIGADPIDLLTLMSFETGGTLSPSIRGPHVPGQGKAVGLIQFMPATAQELGTSTEELAAMSPVAQLDYVERYLIKRGYLGGGLKQLYSTVFAGHPNARGSISDGYHSLDSAVERMNREHRPRAIAILGGSQLEKTKAIISTWPEQFQREPSSDDIIAGYPVTSPRGWRTIKGKRQFHQGVDLATPVNTPLYALADGWVECKQSDAAGKVASFSSDLFPALEFKLLHLNKCVAKPGSKLQVKQGEVIGWTGNTGFSTGAHLDLRIKYQVTGKWLRVRTGWLYWFVTGEKPLSSPN